MYGGKGGVGKTTCAAARAIAEARTGASVLIVSTDPAHSLGDAFRVRLSERAKPLRAPGWRLGRLDAVELDAARALGRWHRQHRAALGDILEHGTWLERADVETLIDLPVPGIDELAGLLEIARLASTPRYEVIVVDTAPTGHTLRLLTAPASVTAFAGMLDALEEQHRYIRRQFGGAWSPDRSERLIACHEGLDPCAPAHSVEVSVPRTSRKSGQAACRRLSVDPRAPGVPARQEVGSIHRRDARRGCSSRRDRASDRAFETAHALVTRSRRQCPDNVARQMPALSLDGPGGES
jgi:hypothetical protein